MSALNFSFAPKFRQNGIFPAQILYLLKKIFEQEEHFLTD